jgi:hypothetical protein
MGTVTRRDDGVHRFLTERAEEIVTALMEPEFVEGLRSLLPRDHRENRFTLPTLLWLGMFGAAHAAMRSMEAILRAACAAVEGVACLPLGAKTLTQSGWSRAKGRLSLGLLRRVWRHWVEVARCQAGDAACFHGMRLVALDKKTLCVPEALWTTFGAHRGCRGDGPAQAELMMAYDVCTRTPLEMTLGKVRTDERVLASRLLRKLPAASLMLIDSGFYGIVFFWDVRAAGHHFVTRMRSNGTPKHLRWLGRDDGLYEIRGNASHYEKKGLPVPEPMTVRILTVQWPGFRAERLVTSLLDAEAFPQAGLIDLYHRRWHIEVFFRELGEDLHAEHWHTRKLKGLYVELLFHMITISAVRAEMAKAATAARVSPGALSFARSSDACLLTWCRIGKSPPGDRAALRSALTAHLATLHIDVRPGRQFERDTQKRRAASRRKKLEALEKQRDAA